MHVDNPAMLNLQDLQVFVHVVDAGSFTAAARRLGAPKSTLSKRVAALEAELGVQLLRRAPRQLQLTDTGTEVLAEARGMLAHAEAAEAAARQRLAEPSGTVRLTAAVPVAQLLLAPHLPALAEALPQVRLELHVTDRFVDVLQEGFDIALRSHAAPLADSALVQRRLAVEAFWLVASPGWLARHGMPADPAALAACDALPSSLSPVPWQLTHADGRVVSVTPRARLVADEGLVLLQAAEAGLGIARLPAELCGDALAAGRLQRVLPDWTAGHITTTLLMPPARSRLPAVRAVVEALAARLGA
jgi:DNA-binding transcriptional LysR family regulator